MTDLIRQMNELSVEDLKKLILRAQLMLEKKEEEIELERKRQLEAEHKRKKEIEMLQRRLRELQGEANGGSEDLGKRTCPYCHKMVTAESKFCSFCGKSI